MKKHNLHTHTTYSDGVLTPKELINKAMESRLEILGISDHAFSKKLPETFQITNRLGIYLNHLKKLKEEYKKHTNLDLKIGIEIDVSKNYGINPSKLPFEILNNFDYALFEYVNTKFEYWGEVGSRDISSITKVRNKLLIPVGLAHNDLQKNYDGRELEIAKILSDNKIFIEINHSEFHSRRNVGRNTREGKNYYEHFSKKLLDELVKNNVRFIVGTDFHIGLNLSDLEKPHKFIEENNLKYHSLVL